MKGKDLRVLLVQYVMKRLWESQEVKRVDRKLAISRHGNAIAPLETWANTYYSDTAPTFATQTAWLKAAFETKHVGNNKVYSFLNMK